MQEELNSAKEKEVLRDFFGYMTIYIYIYICTFVHLILSTDFCCTLRGFAIKSS